MSCKYFRILLQVLSAFITSASSKPNLTIFFLTCSQPIRTVELSIITVQATSQNGYPVPFQGNPIIVWSHNSNCQYWTRNSWRKSQIALQSCYSVRFNFLSNIWTWVTDFNCHWMLCLYDESHCPLHLNKQSYQHKIEQRIIAYAEHLLRGGLSRVNPKFELFVYLVWNFVHYIQPYPYQMCPIYY